MIITGPDKQPKAEPPIDESFLYALGQTATMDSLAKQFGDDVDNMPIPKKKLKPPVDNSIYEMTIKVRRIETDYELTNLLTINKKTKPIVFRRSVNPETYQPCIIFQFGQEYYDIPVPLLVLLKSNYEDDLETIEQNINVLTNMLKGSVNVTGE